MKDFCIVTGCASGFGNGHISRMISLLSLLDAGGYSVVFCSKNLPPFFPRSFLKFCAPEPVRSKCIIRDLRDSSEEEIRYLRSLSETIIVIDDEGAGRSLAQPIDILPRPGRSINSDFFLYGYNFVSFIISQNASKLPIEKSYDLYLYGVAEELSDFFAYSDIQFLLPREGRVVFHERARQQYLTISVSEALAKSRFVLTHYGLSVFEALALNINVGLVNPTSYHNKLSENLVAIRSDDRLTNYGTIDDFNRDDLLKDIEKTLQAHNNTLTPAEISRNIASAHNQVLRAIISFYID